MISITNTNIFYEIEISNSVKSLFKSNDKKLQDLMKEKEVIEFIKLSQNILIDNKYNHDELVKFHKLMNTSKVKEYLERIQFVDPIDQIISAVTGSTVGAIIGTGIALSTNILPVSLLAILGGISGGYLTKKISDKIIRILKSWNYREELYKKSRGTDVVKTNISVTKK